MPEPTPARPSSTCEPVDTSHGRGGLEWCRTHDRLWSVCRHSERETAADLRRRIDRTLAYIEELQPERLSSDARLTLDAVRRSLITPSPKGSDPLLLDSKQAPNSTLPRGD